ncbi:MAG TPA: hypothetical protein ACFYD6_08950 [Candidatus Brocadiia bacterium]|nr:hypothetical protein [Planctomycetota bacterium]MDO8093608.1 hypothetical protein [Candidatus Brocadiales bacterium]
MNRVTRYDMLKSSVASPGSPPPRARLDILSGFASLLTCSAQRLNHKV